MTILIHGNISGLSRKVALQQLKRRYAKGKERKSTISKGMVFLETFTLLCNTEVNITYRTS